MNTQLIALQNTFQPSKLTMIQDSWLKDQGIELWLKRDDLIHPIISGNKWRKLKYCLEHALTLNTDTLVSMGGAYSNHLHALAYAGKQLGLKTKGIIRGEQINPTNPTVRDLLDWGMELTYVSRSDYRELRAIKDGQAFPNLTPGTYWIPEGGASRFALQGVAELVSEISLDFDVFCVPCGTGTTLAGLLTRPMQPTRILGFAALKNASFLINEVEQLLTQPTCNEWSINLDYHCGGFAKVTPELRQFIQIFEKTTGILLDPVYTGKMLYGIYDLIQRGYFTAGQKLLALHTGGLQGRRSELIKHIDD